MRTASLLLVVVLCGCADSLPVDPAELYGFWAAEDGDEWRAIEFAETLPPDDLADLSPVYQTYTYPIGDEPIERHRGGYLLGSGVIAWTVTWADDANEIGEVLSNNIDGWTGDTMTLSGGNDDLEFEFARLNALP